MASDFGPVTLKWQLADGGRTLRIEYEPKWRRPPRAVVLHVPPLASIAKVMVNGKEQPASGGQSLKL